MFPGPLIKVQHFDEHSYFLRRK